MEVCSKVEECQRNFSLSIAKVHCKPSLQNHYAAAADIQTPNHPLKIHVLRLTLCCFILKYAFLTMQSENNKFKHILILWPWIMKAVTLHQIIHSIITERYRLVRNTIRYILFWVSFFSKKTERVFNLKCHTLRSFPVMWDGSQVFWLAKHRAA